VFLLLRLRFLVEEPDKKPLLAEEVFVCGLRGFPPDQLEWLPENRALELLQNARPDMGIAASERSEWLTEVLGWWESLQPGLQPIIQQRAHTLSEAHRRVRAAVHLPRRGLTVTPHRPPDLLGILVCVPIPKGTRGDTLSISSPLTD
jgi:hypothetical protein